MVLEDNAGGFDRYQPGRQQQQVERAAVEALQASSGAFVKDGEVYPSVLAGGSL
jgi:hypothetical protein